MRKNIFLIFLLIAMSVPVFSAEETQPQNAVKKFSLSGGNIGGKFNLAGAALWAKEFEDFFAQTAAFVNNKEFGVSVGIGLPGENFGAYIFAETLYNQKFFFQIRPVIRLRFPWMSLSAFYAFPVGGFTTRVGDETISAVKYGGGELNIVPVDWLRLYAEAQMVEKSYSRYRAGAEIQVLKWLSFSADWNKTNSNLYSKWSGYEDLRVAMNFLLGSQRQSFKPNQRIQMQPMYPILIKKAKSEPPDIFVEGKGAVEFMYERMSPVNAPKAQEPYWMQIITLKDFQLISTKYWRKYGENKWICEAELEYSRYAYAAYTLDLQITGNIYKQIGYKIWARIKGTETWIELTCIRPDPSGTGNRTEFFFDSNGIRVPSF